MNRGEANALAARPTGACLKPPPPPAGILILLPLLPARRMAACKRPYGIDMEPSNSAGLADYKENTMKTKSTKRKHVEAATQAATAVAGPPMLAHVASGGEVSAQGMPPLPRRPPRRNGRRRSPSA